MTSTPHHSKIILSSQNGFLVAFDINTTDLTVTTYKLIILSNKFNLFKILRDNNQYLINDQSEFMNFKSLKYSETKIGNITQGSVSGFIVIENSPLYQIEITYELEEKFFQHPVLSIRKVFEGYGDY